MLEILQGVLGLIPPEEADMLRQKLQNHNQRDSEEFHLRTSNGAPEILRSRKRGGCRDTTWDGLCGPIAKFGYAFLNTYRTKFAKLISCIAVLSFLYCAGMVFYGISEDYSQLRTYSWASGKIALKTDATESLLSLNWKQEEFDLGIMSFAYSGDEIIKNVSFLQYGSFEMFEYDTACATATQRYNSIALNYGKIFQPVAVRPLNTSVCFAANCQLRTFVFSDYVEGCFADSEQSTSGTFEDSTCIVAPLALGNISHTVSFKINCKQHVEEEEFAGYLPVITAKAAATIRKVAFEIVLGGVTAADLTISVIATLKESVSGNQRFICSCTIEALHLPGLSVTFCVCSCRPFSLPFFWFISLCCCSL